MALGARLLALTEAACKEEECLRYGIYHSNEEPNAWFVYEDWCSREEFEAHMQAAQVQDFLTALPSLCGRTSRPAAYRRVSRMAA